MFLSRGSSNKYPQSMFLSRGSSNKYPQSMFLSRNKKINVDLCKYPQSIFLSRNKKINVDPCKPQFYCIKVGFKMGSKLYRRVFMVKLKGVLNTKLSS